MAKATVEGNGKRSLKPSFSSKLKKLAVATPGIIGASVLEGIGGPKAKAGGKVASFAARTGRRIIAERKGAAILAEKAARTGKISKIAARREAEKAAGKKATGPAGTNRAGDGSIRAKTPKPNPIVEKKATAKLLAKTKPVTIERVGTGKNPAKVEELKQAKIEKATAEKAARREEIFGKKSITPKPKKRGLTIGDKKRIARVEKNIAKGRKEFVTERKRQAELKAKRNVDYKDKTPVTLEEKMKFQGDKLVTVATKTTKGKLAQLQVEMENASTNPRLEGVIKNIKPQRTIKEREPAYFEKEGEIINLKSGRNVESQMTKQELKDALEAARRTRAVPKKDMPNSTAVAKAARQRPGLAKRKAISIAESRARANVAMNKKGLTPAAKKTLIMKSRAKARKIREGTK